MSLVFCLVCPPHRAPALTFTGPALMELKGKDDVIRILTELTDEALGLAELERKDTGSKMRQSTPQELAKRVNTSEGRSKI